MGDRWTEKAPDYTSTPNLYYLTHVDNLISILEHGILSHNEVERREIPHVAIYEPEIIELRNSKNIGNFNLLHFANLFFQPRNAMLYLVLNKLKENNRAISEIIVLQISNELLKRDDIYLSDKVAARHDARIEPNNASFLNEICSHSDPVDWHDGYEIDNAIKERLLAECLVPNQVNPNFIERIWVADPSLTSFVRRELTRHRYSPTVDADERMFFNMFREYTLWLAGKLSVRQGDMFESHLQTLTIPVNTEGVMGKGAAWVAKKGFPNMYKYYRQLCYRKQLHLGEPLLYPPQSPLFDEHQDEGGKKLLLFPTKGHWRSRSRLGHIQDGFDHFRERYQEWGVRSLALPALGCGYGGISWEDVRQGILPCLRKLAMDIPVAIYLVDPSHVAIEKESEQYEFFQQIMWQSI